MRGVEKMAKDITSKRLTQMVSSLIKDQTLVVDIGSHTVKVLDVTKKGEHLTINGFLEIENVEKYFNGKDIVNHEGLANDIKRVLKVADLKAKKMDIVYNSAQLQTKIIKVPMMTEKDVKEFVEIEYHKSFTNISPVTHIMDYLPLGVLQEEDRSEQSILIATVPIVESTKLLKVFETKEMQVNAIETNIHALGNAVNLVDTESDYKLILHMGKEYSLILFSKGNIPTFYRMFPFGHNQLSRKIQEELQTSLSSVDNAMKNLGFYPDEEFKTDIDLMSYDYTLKEGFSNFMNEVYRSINYVKMNSKFDADKIYLSGGMANMKGIEEYVEENLSMPAVKWQFERSAKNDYVINMKGQEKLGPEFALVLGLSARGWM